MLDTSPVLERASSLPTRTDSLWITFNFRTSRITISKNLYLLLLADQTRHIDFLFDSSSCYITRTPTGQGLYCNVSSVEASGVRSIYVKKQTFIERMRLVLKHGPEDTVKIMVTRNPIEGVSGNPQPMYRLIL